MSWFNLSWFRDQYSSWFQHSWTSEQYCACFNLSWIYDQLAEGPGVARGKKNLKKKKFEEKNLEFYLA